MIKTPVRLSAPFLVSTLQRCLLWYGHSLASAIAQRAEETTAHAVHAVKEGTVYDLREGVNELVRGGCKVSQWGHHFARCAAWSRGVSTVEHLDSITAFCSL